MGSERVVGGEREWWDEGGNGGREGMVGSRRKWWVVGKSGGRWEKVAGGGSRER